jgi:ABC-type nitrate/sulfonate/bicarbonate transport system permease component
MARVTARRAQRVGGADLSGRRFYVTHERAILGSLAVVAVGLLWEGSARGWWGWQVEPVFLSAPTAIVHTAVWLFAAGEIWTDLGVSALEFLLGFAMAVLAGIALGLAAGWYRRFAFALEPFVSALNATPRVALLPLIIIWVGIGIWSKVLVVFLGAVVPIYLNVVAGVRTTDVRLLRVARSFGSSEAQLFRSIILPSALPFLLSGLRLGVGRAMVGVVVGEFYAATAGVGFMIMVAGANFQTDKVFVGVALIALAGVLIVEALSRLERRFDRWRVRG